MEKQFPNFQSKFDLKIVAPMMDACSEDGSHDLQETRTFYMEIISTILEKLCRKGLLPVKKSE